MEFTFRPARALGNICAPGLLKLRSWGVAVEKVRGLCFPYGQEGVGRAADGHCVLYLGSKQEGEKDVM